MRLQNIHSTLDAEIPSGCELLHTLKNPEGSIFSLGWSPDGKTLAIGTTENVIQLWDAQRAELRSSLKHESPVSSILWAPDGQMLATGLWNKTLNLWDAHSGGLCWTLEHQGIISSLAWNPDARVLTTGTGESLIYLWNAKSGNCSKNCKDILMGSFAWPGRRMEVYSLQGLTTRRSVSGTSLQANCYMP